METSGTMAEMFIRFIVIIAITFNHSQSSKMNVALITSHRVQAQTSFARQCWGDVVQEIIYLFCGDLYCPLQGWCWTEANNIQES